MDKATLSARFKNAAAELLDNQAYLSDLDAKFGDGDHGITIGKVAAAINEGVDAWTDQPLKDFISDVANRCMSIQGGACGSLWGTLIGGMASSIDEGETEVSTETLKKMFQNGLDDLSDITRARVGGKTMMDALIPAVEAIAATDGDVQAMLDAAAKASEEGARKTADFPAKFGRAKNYKERSIGSVDPGAVSTSMFFKGLAKPV